MTWSSRCSYRTCEAWPYIGWAALHSRPPAAASLTCTTRPVVFSRQGRSFVWPRTQGSDHSVAGELLVGGSTPAAAAVEPAAAEAAVEAAAVEAAVEAAAVEAVVEAVEVEVEAVAEAAEAAEAALEAE